MQCVKLMFTRSNDSATQQYIIYRALGDGEPLPVYVVEHPSDVNPIQIKGDRLLNSGEVYYTSYGNILKDYDIIVKVDGEPTDPATIDYEAGSVTFDPALDPGAVVTMDYWFDGIEVLDTKVPQKGVTILAEQAIDRSPPRPVNNLRIIRDHETGLVRLEYDLPPTTAGTVYRYYVVAADRVGNKSWPSPSVDVTLNHSLGEVPFIIERSVDEGETWEIAAETAEQYFLDKPHFVGAMGVVSNPQIDVQVIDGKGTVVLKWQAPQMPPGTTPMYRIRTRSALNAVSDPSVTIGPESFERVAVKYHIYKAVSGGSPELFDTVTTTSLTDNTIEPYMTYEYTIVAVDALGNESDGVTVSIQTGDLIPPLEPYLVDVTVTD